MKIPYLEILHIYLNDLCHYYRFSLLTGWIYYVGKLEEAPKENVFAIS